jgi:hypothetical protein
MDLANASNWAKVYDSSLTARLTAQYGSGPGSILIFDPIPSVTTSLATPVAIVKCTSLTANPKWFTGSYFNAYQQLGQRVIIFSKKCSLKSATLCLLPNYGIIPYEVEFTFPHWIEDIKIELWQFTDQSGQYLPVSDQVLFSAVEIVEQKVAELSQLRVLDVQIVQGP